MKLYGVTFTYNESTMVPYVMKYLERMGFDKLIVYDNQSTDNTVDLLKNYPFVEIRILNTGGSKSNQKIVDIKNNIWKEFSNEEDAWMFVSDFDEVVYYGGEFKKYLEKMDVAGYNYLNQDMFQTICEHFPDKEKLVHEICDGGTFWGNSPEGGCKMTLFRIRDFVSITYTPGAHRVRVKLKSGYVLKPLNNKDIKSFHLKFIDKDYCLGRKHLAKARRGPDDIKKGYGNQYNKPDSEFLNQWSLMKKNAINVSDYVSGRVNGSDGSRNITSDTNSGENTKKMVSLMYSDIQNTTKVNLLKKRVVIRKFRN